MHTCMYVCVCVCVCMYVCVHGHLAACTCLCKLVCVCVCVCGGACVRVYTFCIAPKVFKLTSLALRSPSNVEKLPMSTQTKMDSSS